MTALKMQAEKAPAPDGNERPWEWMEPPAESHKQQEEKGLE